VRRKRRSHRWFPTTPNQASFVSAGVFCVAAVLSAQAPLVGPGATVHINNSDMAILETPDVRKDLQCTVSPNKPVLGFDLRFHAGYDVSIPLNDLSGGENQLTILFRVTPEARKDDPRYFIQRIHVPSIDEDAKGDATLSGMLDLGEGNYHVDWLVRDRSERVCSFYWDSEAALQSKDKQMELDIPPGMVQRSESNQFAPEPPVERVRSPKPLSIKVLVNFAPQNADSSAMRPIDTVALVTMLRRISREPQFEKFSLVAFNIQEQRVLYRQSSADKIDFPALGGAVDKIQLGTVDLNKLAQKHGDTEFLSDLIQKEMSGEDRPDAVIFAGPKLMLDDSVPDEALKPFAANVDYPVFYMNYNLDPRAVPWKDSISHAVRLFRGTEYSITRPRDLWFAVSEMVSRIVKSKHGRAPAPVPSQ
jgi:hypothetical protein